MTGSSMLMLAAADQALSQHRQTRGVLCGLALLPILIIILILAAPLAIFFAIFSPSSAAANTAAEGSSSTIIASLRQEFQHKITVAAEKPDWVDEVQIIYADSPDNVPIDNSDDVLSVYAVMQSCTEDDPEPVAIIDSRGRDTLSSIFWRMNTIDVITIHDESEQPGEPGRTIRTVTVVCKTAIEAADLYNFTDEQRQILADMCSEQYAQLRGEDATQLTPEDMVEIKAMLPPDLSIERQKIVEAALSIRGQCHYFWGGKSEAIGPDPRWGVPTRVRSAGSPSSGTTRPYGMDCSGYVYWAVLNGTGLPAKTLNNVLGKGSSIQFRHCTAIAKEDVIPGDLAFFAVPGKTRVNHVGIVAGYDEAGRLLVAHCSSSRDNVVVTDAEKTGFKLYRRPALLQ